MAHELTTVNGKVAMAYLAGTNPWHGLGNELPEGAAFEEWLAASGMVFEILPATVSYRIARAPTDPTTPRRRVLPIVGRQGTVENRRVLYRSDTGDSVGIVSSRYKVVQPREILEFFRELAEQNTLKLKTAGVLRGGSRYWALAQTELATEVKKDHRHELYVLLSTSADASLATTARKTDICVVCNNTLTMATQRDEDGVYKTRHDSAFDVKSAKQHLGLETFADEWKEFAATLKALNKIKIEEEEAAEWFRRLLKSPKEREQEAEADLKAENFADLLQSSVKMNGETGVQTEKDLTPQSILKKVAVLQDAYANAPGAAPGTAYGLVQAATYFVDHLQGRSVDARMNSAWFGDGETLKNRALSDATALLSK